MTFLARTFVAACVLVLASRSYCDEPQNPSKVSEPIKIRLWSQHAPTGDGNFEQAETWITVYRSSTSNAAAIVICPGGGYGGLAIEPEGHGIARWLNSHGIAGVVLEYRLPKGRSMVPLLDAQRALRVVRERAGEWSIDPKRIGIMGFSVGGHLASTAGTHFDSGNQNSTDPIERSSCRPDFMILIYPVILFGEKAHQGTMKNLLGSKPTPEKVEWFSSEKQVTSATPPTFLAHALNDRIVPPEHSKAFHTALQANGVAARYLELPTGDHGLNGYKGPMWDSWQSESLEWLNRIAVKPDPGK